MTGWGTSRRELIIELRGVERLADERLRQRERLAEQLRQLQAEHETKLRELDDLRSRNAELEATLSIDLNVASPCGDPHHRTCVPVAEHMQLVNELDRLRTVPRTGGQP